MRMHSFLQWVGKRRKTLINSITLAPQVAALGADSQNTFRFYNKVALDNDGGNGKVSQSSGVHR